MSIAEQPGSPLAEWQLSLRSKAKELLHCLEAGHFADAAGVVQALAAEREHGLYRQVGQLTRELHSAIVNFQIDAVGGESVDGASKRLSYVVELTEKAANRTMDLVEQSAPLAVSLANRSKALNAQLQPFLRDNVLPEPLAAQLAEFLDECGQSGRTLSINLNEILLAQDFQDLTGQLIKRVTGMITGIERDLLQLMLTASSVEHLVGNRDDIASRLKQQARQKQASLAAGEGPVLEAAGESQDDVDELLSSLGF